jgi:oligopeptide/dipeptide ABC transporter ATP-binding protein
MTLAPEARVDIGEPLLEVHNLSTSFRTWQGVVRAVDGVSFHVQAGEAVGLVGESGAGKSTVLRSLLRLVDPPGRIVGGAVLFGGQDLRTLPEAQLRRMRGGRISAIFQDPVKAFNPGQSIRSQLRRVLRLHRREPPLDGYDREIERMLSHVGVDSASSLDGNASECSPGELQRIMIAAACLGGEPALLLADEPTTNLDVTIEAQVLELVRDLRRELGLAMILATRNLALVAELCDHVLVMYAGRLVEEGTVYQVFEHPSHPYTEQLLRTMPRFPHGGGRLYTMRGSMPDQTTSVPGCPFAPRCEQYIGEVCDTRVPTLRRSLAIGQRAACHLYPGAS